MSFFLEKMSKRSFDHSRGLKAFTLKELKKLTLNKCDAQIAGIMFLTWNLYLFQKVHHIQPTLKEQREKYQLTKITIHFSGESSGVSTRPLYLKINAVIF